MGTLFDRTKAFNNLVSSKPHLPELQLRRHIKYLFGSDNVTMEIIDIVKGCSHVTLWREGRFPAVGWEH